MKVVLLKDVPKLGKKFDVKEVSGGYALNSLIPRGLVAVATETLVKRMDGEKAIMSHKLHKEEEILAKNLSTIDKLVLEMTAKASIKGHLFSSIHKAEIAAQVQRVAGISIDAEFVKLEKPIKEVGDHVVEIVAGGKTAKLKLIVKAE